jgi:16S rRNA (adenine(1408)-N(1))-methyltransferase
MIIVHGKQTAEIDAAAFGATIAPYAGVTIDVGAGDGRFAYRYASAHAGRFVVGIDPVAENLRELSAKAARKPERGGLANVLYAVASIEHVPAELRGIADEIFVTLPWGSLMRGIILGDDAVLGGLASLARDGAALRIVLNTRIFDDPVPIDVRDLPDVTPDYVRETLAPLFARHGIAVTETRFMDADEVAAIETTWAKRLSHRRPPRSMLIEGTIHEGH